MEPMEVLTPHFDVVSWTEELLRDDATILHDMSRFYNESDLSDVVLIVGKERFYAHKFVLAKSSEVFRAMLYDKIWEGDQKAEIELSESPECQACFDKFLRYLYSAEVAVRVDNVVGIMCLADKYGMTSLKTLCSDYMLDNSVCPNLHTALRWYPWTKALLLGIVQDRCFEAIAWNFHTIMNSSVWLSTSVDFLVDLLQSSQLVVPSEFALWQAVCKWLLDDENIGEFKENVSQVLPLIRFPQMLVSDLHRVEQSEMFSKPECSELLKERMNLAYRFRSLCPSQDDLEPEVTFKDDFHQPRDYTDLGVDDVNIRNTMRFGIQVDVKMYKGAVPHENREADWKITYRKQGDTWQIQLLCHETGLVNNQARVQPSVIVYNNDDQVVQVHREATSLLTRGKTLTVQITLRWPDVSQHMAILIKPVPV